VFEGSKAGDFVGFEARCRPKICLLNLATVLKKKKSLYGSNCSYRPFPEDLALLADPTNPQCLVTSDGIGYLVASCWWISQRRADGKFAEPVKAENGHVLEFMRIDRE